jgi:hypothetical protein
MARELDLRNGRVIDRPEQSPVETTDENEDADQDDEEEAER